MRIPVTGALRAAVAAILALALLACGSDTGSAGREKGGRSVKRPPVQTQTLGAPCDVLPVAEVEKILGKLAAPPVVAYSAKTRRPDREGAACLYKVVAQSGAAKEVAVQIDPYGAPELSQAMDMLGGIFAAEGGGDAAKKPAVQKSEDGWDETNALPEIAAYRAGHIAIHIGDEPFYLSSEQSGTLARAVFGRLKDLPVSAPGYDSNAAGPEPDPCKLLTRAEAEAVLGKLIVEPYRSYKQSAIADTAGESCAYYTSGHRALVLTPDWSDGKMLFDMAGGVGSLLRPGAGGADKGDLLEGPWDQATSSAATGSLYFLKGDKMLEATYLTSSTELAGVTKLARTAVERL
jgi:hypothetical protein